jgi:hypothetical protein
MSDDIVARLRVLASEFPTVNDWMDNEWKNAADEIERLRNERDEARRMYLASTYNDDEIIHEMKRHGWDCFKEER